MNVICMAAQIDRQVYCDEFGGLAVKPRPSGDGQRTDGAAAKATVGARTWIHHCQLPATTLDQPDGHLLSMLTGGSRPPDFSSSLHQHIDEGTTCQATG
jgi:hypothetical protein